jgi:transposase-like protein
VKYVTRLGGGKGGGTTKFICPHCHKTYTSSYTFVRKHLYGIMPWDEGKTIGVKTCQHVKEEEVAQNKSKKSRVEYEISQRTFSGRSPSPYAIGFFPVHSRRRTI